MYLITYFLEYTWLQVHVFEQSSYHNTFLLALQLMKLSYRNLCALKKEKECNLWELSYEIKE